MAQAQQDDTVKVHYRGTLQDGTVFDSSFKKEPMEFTIGQNMVIPGFEKGVVGMKVGQTHTINIAAPDAYGHYRDDLVIIVERSAFPSDANLKPGTVMKVHLGHGDDTNVTIKELTDENVVLDGNHPLAGEDLTFEIQLVELVRADTRA
jgi:peptidylprolyl isomerase